MCISIFRRSYTTLRVDTERRIRNLFLHRRYSARIDVAPTPSRRPDPGLNLEHPPLNLRLDSSPSTMTYIGFYCHTDSCKVGLDCCMDSTWVTQGSITRFDKAAGLPISIRAPQNESGISGVLTCPGALFGPGGAADGLGHISGLLPSFHLRTRPPSFATP